MNRFLLFSFLCFPSVWVLASDSLPDVSRNFLDHYCLDCHDAGSLKGEIDLSRPEIAWSNHGDRHLWERVLNVLHSGEMPPKKKRQPNDHERAAMIAWIDGALTEHTPIGGTLARRLNQAEYRSTIESLFGIKAFSLPVGFPADREHHGFDNLGEGLVLSPPLLQAYSEAARLVADRVFPSPRQAVARSVRKAGANDLTISYSSGKVVDGAMRLGMRSDPIFRSCTWPSRIEAEASGVYTVTLELSALGDVTPERPMEVHLFARDVASQDSIRHTQLRLLQEIELTDSSSTVFEFEAELYEGQTPVILWANAPLDSDREDKATMVDYFVERDKEQPGYLAAWHTMVNGRQQGFRGGVGWERVRTLLEEGDLPELSEKQREAMLKRIRGNPVLYAETVIFEVFENGPALEVRGLALDGPHRLVDGPREKESQRLRAVLTGEELDPIDGIRHFISRAFRRPVDDLTLDTYVGLYEQHRASGHSSDEAMHLLIRNVLISPRFLYRCLSKGSLDSYDLATRLAYFLTGAPPDELLRENAASGRLSDPDVLQSEALRLMPRNAASPFIENFTGQWLDTRLLDEIMPDPKFNFRANDEVSAKSEVEYFFHEILSENRPMSDFIDPDFTWTSARVAKNVYGLTEGFDPKKGNVIHRISLPRGGRYGGVLGQAAVMLATANGVDTQPVLRGVWVLENILGTPPPPPPKAVPAITPDTKGTITPRELLAAHTSESACAGCHRKIDPVGFVLENFDPVGRWRDEWPGIKVPIDASSTLPDGTPIRDIVDFKKWLVENIDQFSRCLAEKLMTYATGRFPNYSERKEIAEIVAQNREGNQGFQDLLLALIGSETFRTK